MLIFFFFLYQNLIIFGCSGSSLLLGLSLVAESGDCSLVVVHGFLLLWLLLLLSMGCRWAGSVVVSHRLKLLCGMCDLPGPGIEPMCPALQGRFFNHWTTRETPKLTFLK